MNAKAKFTVGRARPGLDRPGPACELQFVPGRYVADVFCYAPFVADASPEYASSVRTLAEASYRGLG
jgi:hypothetical protein